MDIVFLMAVMVLAGAIKGLSGFGQTLFMLPLLALFLPIKLVPPFLILTGLMMDSMMALKLHRHAPWKKIVPIFLCSIPGSWAGIYLLKRIDVSFVQIVIGIMLILFSAYFLFTKPKHRGTRFGWIYPTGFVSGFLGGMMGTAGPPVIVFAALQKWKKEITQSFFVHYFLIFGVVATFSFWKADLLTQQVCVYFLWSLPALVLGILIGQFFYKKATEEFYRKIVLVILLLLGVFTLVKGVF